MASALKSIETKIIKLLDQQTSQSIQIAELLLEAFEYHFDKSKPWEEWAKARLKIERRYCYELRSIAILLKNPEVVRRAALLAALRALPIRKLSLISAIPAKSLASFLKANDIDGMDRDEIRDAVNAFLGRSPDKCSRFISYNHLPHPDRLIAGLDDPKTREKIDFTTEKAYLAAHIRRIEVIMADVDQRELFALYEDMKVSFERNFAGIGTT